MTKPRLAGGALIAVVLAAVLFRCGSSTSSQPPPTVKQDPSFASDIQPIFNTHCTSNSCHDVSGSGGLILLQGQSYLNLVNVASAEDPGKIRVIPGDAQDSYLVIKIEGRQTIGSQMPLAAGPLDTNSVQNIKNWINKGAKNN